MENYQFIKQIGHGSYGEVWLVKCSRTRRRHVLKRIDLHQVSKREQRTAYLEAKLLSTIKHPNIVTYLDSFHNSFGSLFIVMCYCECGDLYSFIRNQNGVHFEEKQIVHWFVQICLALKYLHDKNILHRNLKTKNIFLTKNNIVKVGDLGIPKVQNITYEMTSTSIEAPCYFSPEVFAGAPHNEKSDVWALGCCVYEMATLKAPYVIQDIYAAMQKKIKRKLSSIPEIYSVELYEITCCMLDVDSENRPCITELLLNEYVRRYILLILQDNSKSPDSENSHASSMDRSKSNSDLSLAVFPKDTSNGIPRSKSTCFLSRNTIKIPKTPSNLTKDKMSKSIVTTVPDVNGNGDGNDNSQHGRNAHAHRKVEQKSSKVNCDKNKDSPENDESIKNAMKLQLNATPNGDNFLPTHSKNFEMNAISKKQKMKGEISFQILNSLAYTLYSVRPENLDRISVSSNGHSDSEFSFIKPHQSYSFVNGHSEKQLVRKAVKSVKCDKAKEHYQNNVCTLPEIKCESKYGRVTKSSDDSHNLPHVK